MSVGNIIKNPRAMAALVGLIALAAYAPVLTGGFVLGDQSLVSGRLGVSPLANILLAVQYGAFAQSAVGFHLVGILLHAVNAVLVLVIGRTLIGDEHPWPAVLGAMLFALHPANTEAVAWVSAQAELVYTMLVLSSFLSYLRFERNGRGQSAVLSAGLFMLALMASVKAIAFPLVIALYALAVAGRAEGGPGRWARVAYLASLAALGVLGLAVLRSLQSVAEALLVLRSPLADVLAGLGLYLGKLFVPIGLGLFPAVPESPLYHLIIVALLAAIAFLYHGKFRVEAFLAAWALIALLPSFLTVSLYGNLLAEQHLYLPAAALSLLVASALSHVKMTRPFAVLGVCVLVVFALGTLVRATQWRDEQSLLARSLARGPDDVSYEQPVRASTILTALGVARMEEDDYKAARQHLLGALEADDKNYLAYYNAGRLYERMDKRLGHDNEDERVSLAREAVAILGRGAELLPQHVDIHYNLGIWYMRVYEWDEAERTLKYALRRAPGAETAGVARKYLEFIGEVKKRGLWGYNAPAK